MKEINNERDSTDTRSKNFDYLKIKEDNKVKQIEKNNQFYNNLISNSTKSTHHNAHNEKLLSYVSTLDQLKLEDYNNTKKLQETLLYNINQKVGLIKKELESHVKRDMYYKELNDLYNNKIQNEQNNSIFNIQSYKGSTYEERNCNIIK